ncbi:MAG: Ty3/Gypsy family RNase HI domain-containing protein, partial [Ignavibacteria bacterium]|nr:Ty3/Gypsy family RNase HI domain-containing protein [Ignavibacteria bacterium]
AAPIHRVTNLTKPNRRQFVWGDTQKQAFLQLKELLINSPLFLDFPSDDYPLILTTDASKVGIGGTLQQKIDGEIKNLYYHSQVTNSTQRRYDPIELEALAIWLCFQRMRSYLLGRSIIIYTDHCPLCNMMNSSVKNRRVDRISILLQEYNIEKIIHIKGQHNCLADYLSRHPIPREEEIFDEDYGIAKRDKGEPPVIGRVPDETPPLAGAVVTRSKAKQLQLKQGQDTTTITPSTKKTETSSSTMEEIVDTRKNSSSEDIQKYGLDMKQLKNEQET